MEHPPADPSKLLEVWMQWERGDELPGRTLGNLKIAGMRQLLEQLSSEHALIAGGTVDLPVDAGSWTPIV